MSNTKRFRLTKASKILIMVLVIVLIGGGVFAGLKSGLVTSKHFITTDEDGNVINMDKSDDKTINLSLDEWIG